jgi:hypothetical protein
MIHIPGRYIVTGASLEHYIYAGQHAVAAALGASRPILPLRACDPLAPPLVTANQVNVLNNKQG